MNSRSIGALGALLLLGVPALAAPAAPAGGRNDPGSLLVFPEVDGRPGRMTFLTVTNTNGDPQDGTVSVHFNDVDGETCLKHDALEVLTPYDTVTVISGAHAPSTQRGFCFAYARAGAAAVDFDHLTGQVMILDGLLASEYSLNALVFQGLTGAGNPTDVDGDGIRDLNGVEYQAAPDQIAIPRFLGQYPPGMNVGFGEDLVLIGLTGTKFTTSVDFLVFNDNEEVFSASYTFDCWERVPLTQISGVFQNSFLANFTNHDPGEILGMPNFEAGWMLLDGGVASSTTTSVSDPAFLAVLIERERLSSADLPYTIGEQTNGDLLPTNLAGDGN